MSEDTLLALGGLITSVIGIIVTIVLAIQARTRPYLAPELPSNGQLPDGAFPALMQVRNRGTAAAGNIRGVIFPEPHLSQAAHAARYSLKGIAFLGEKQIDTFEAQPVAPGVPGDWKIGEYPLAPENTEPSVMARLTLTYQGDDEKRFHASIFDYKRGVGWRPIARLSGVRYDITALEDIYRRRRQQNQPLLPPPVNGFDPGRRRLVISIGVVVVGLVVAGVAKTGVFSGRNKTLASSPTPSPTPTSTPSPTSSVPPGNQLYTRRNYTDEVSSVAWSPDGKRLASGCLDQTLQIWDALTQQHPLALTAPDSVNAVAWSPDGTMIASATDETPPGVSRKAVQVWNAATGAQILIYTGHTDSVEAVAWSPDGTLVASGSDDNTVQVWDAKTGQLVTKYTGHNDTVFSVAWSPDGTLIASGSSDTTVQVWTAKTGQLIYTYTGHTAGVGPAAWSPNGQRIASGSDDKTVQVWDATSGTNVVTYTGHSDGVNALAWSPDGTAIASGSNDKTVQIWEAITRQLVYKYTGHTDAVETVAWQPKETLIASGGDDKTVQVWQGGSV